VASSEPIWSRLATRDLDEADAWYRERSLSAALGFADHLTKALESLAEAPYRWPARRGGLRHYVLPGPYPYSLLYRVHPSGRVEIAALAHHKRHHRTWSRRL
jgi:plasmid stabilization system protein ParE